VILLLLSATFQNSKLAAKNTAQDKKRKLAAENSGTSASFKTLEYWFFFIVVI
jgi:hypothetical protein